MYSHGAVGDTELVGRAITKSEDGITVRASIPGREETEKIFGVQLYDAAVQPVWLEITNGSESRLRFAPVGTDPEYFSPLEIAWKSRGPYSDESRKAMQQRFDALSIPRYVDPGQTISGFLMTHFHPGIKAFNVDLFGTARSQAFTFLLEVPGFRPDYADIDFENLYAQSDLIDVDLEQARSIIRDFGCCATDAQGALTDAPLNAVLIGEGIDLLRSLLRGNWRNLSQAESAQVEPSFLFGRKQDAIFRYGARVNKGYYQMRLWLTQMLVDGALVWAAEVRLIVQNPWSVTHADPDVDLAREFLLQNMWYSQSLERYAVVGGQEVVPAETFWTNLFGQAYFTDGNRTVLWLSAEPVALSATERVEWDDVAGTDND